eukprot:CAMPEP_0205937636 /NCGR_PEP_ID=MMETSP1325-20131115/44681_1 /ASSEMBLY_ACC=CAM_ASM_000708 /TAXON_ID=236786 /ORGANISM="Florenciella sp., Strain RCC1007" /LENGTH=183 /DNA_ID=CAMNT_0053307925 /DNA_START=74 /DNA_END=621 /DNA_ORIENTATION=-
MGVRAEKLPQVSQIRKSRSTLAGASQKGELRQQRARILVGLACLLSILIDFAHFVGEETGRLGSTTAKRPADSRARTWFPCALADDATSIIDTYMLGYSTIQNADTGYAVAKVSDLDGNGRAELAIGAPLYGDNDEGTVYVVLLNNDGHWDDLHKLDHDHCGLTDGANFGRALAGLGSPPVHG